MTSAERRSKLRSVIVVIIIAALALAAGYGLLSERPDDGADQNVTRLGTVEVTAELAEVRGLEEWDGRFPSNDLGYDYVYILKYAVEEIHRGSIEGDTILVGQYNPLKPRAQAADQRPGCENIGGSAENFRVGDVHRMALEVPLDDHYMGPIINKYFGQSGQGALYWAVWTNRVVR